MSMSLRQRGQRPSESTNEGGGYSRQQSSGGGYYYGGSSPSGRAYGYGSPPSTGGSGGGASPTGGGYYGQQQQRASLPYSSDATPNRQQQPAMGAGYPNASSAGYGGAFAQHTPVSHAVAERAGYARANTAPPAYSYGQMANSPSCGGYSGGLSPSTSAVSGFQQKKKSTSSPSFNFGHITNNLLPLLLGLTICILTATTFYFRSSMLRIHSQIEVTKRSMDENIQRSSSTQQQQQLQHNANRFADQQDQQMNEEQSKLMEANNRIQSQITQLTSQHNELTTRHKSLLDIKNQKENVKQNLLKKIDHTTYALQDAMEQINKYKSMVEGKVELEAYMKKREKALWDVVGRLEAKIGRESWREANEWFGQGPHKVEIELEYPKVNTVDPPDTWPRVRSKLIIEMAPIDLMPHSVNVFLQQVHHGLWDGNELIRNVDHIMTFGYRRARAHEGFVDRSLETVSYQEYSAKYPHLQWTVGFMGRPSGPDFYINKLDNSILHGPGGQVGNYDLHNEADPCFGKVVDGFDMLNDINAIPVDKDRGSEFSYPVVIIRARVMARERNDNDVNNGGGGGGSSDGDLRWEEVPQGRMFNNGGVDEIKPMQTQ